MKSKLHFISGLPRSGSTMLAAILKQNAAFVAGMTSPLSTLFAAIENATSQRVETSVFVTDEQRELLLRGLFSTYYHKDWDKKTVFDTSRMWCARMTILNKLFPDARFICCVRELAWIMDSFERIFRRNDQKPSGIYGYNTGTVYSRTMTLASSSGVVGYALDAVKEALASEQTNKILLIDYEDICKDPTSAMKRVYAFIEEDYFSHDFDKVEYSAGEFDRNLGAPGLHEVKGSIQWRPRKSILPGDLFNRFQNDNFWRIVA